MYHKPTDTRQYLHLSSCHPSQTKRTIYILAKRVCTIVSDNHERRNECLYELKASLVKQCYPLGFADDGIKKHWN